MCKKTFDIHQILSIETLQIMEFNPKKYWKSKLLCFFCEFQKYKNIILKNVHPLALLILFNSPPGWMAYLTLIDGIFTYLPFIVYLHTYLSKWPT
jgi:hypothetical protein